ncbi:hypothetical protein CRG98_013268 [Punica granatum]|uniref:Uncharacterized protein n=1 Tax=Punica granatum TaxID=22663 RepID=A0A2I0KER9_PUNGR|nr:hypothetical protein CRG98_013268 [Punica granatum]
MPPSEASQIPVGHVWAYRDFPDDALAALSVVQHARRLWTLLIRVLWGDYICNPHGNFCSELVRLTHLRAAPLNLKWKNSHFATAAPKGFLVVLIFCPSFFLGRPRKGGYLCVEPLPRQSLREKAREEFSEMREPMHHSSSMADACAAVLGKTRGAGSHEDKRVEQHIVGGDSGGRVGPILWSKARSIAGRCAGSRKKMCVRSCGDALCHAGWVVEMDSASGHNASRRREVKTAGGLPAKVGTTCLSL